MFIILIYSHLLTHSLTHTYLTTQTTLTKKPARTHIQADLLCHFILDHSSFQSYFISTCYSFIQIVLLTHCFFSTFNHLNHPITLSHYISISQLLITRSISQSSTCRSIILALTIFNCLLIFTLSINYKPSLTHLLTCSQQPAHQKFM